MFRYTFLFVIFLLIGMTQNSTAQLIKFNKKDDTEKKDKKKNDKIKPYDEIITDEAISKEGLFTSHKVGEDYYFEIPDSLLEEEILVVTRISGFVKNLNFGGAGTKSRPQQVIRFQKKDDNILLREVSYNSVASEDKPIYESVKNNNFEPVIAIFNIETFGDDGDSYVIKLNNLFTQDIPMFGAIYNSQKKRFGIQGVDSKRSYIQSINSYPENVEVRHVLTYRGGSKLPDNSLTGTLSVELNHSFIKLPENPWKPRYYDARVGYFSLTQTDYGADAQKALKKRYITRWRLEPKDWDAYFRGDLVEPVKPIVYYIDPAAPDEWKSYLKQGVDDWQAAFEKIGFKNAIMGKYAPTMEEDSTWTPEDVRYSVMRYVSTDIQNAMGPHVHDPRTGEILESDIIWYHNVMNLLRNWFFIQTAAINPAARSVEFDNAVMGQLIRFVAAHEVGHTLGLPHNMGSSSAYPVDSLRSPSFTRTMGTAPSIMDYARFNYVAQPEDGNVSLMPGIGPYDDWSIKYGYQLLPGELTPEQEKKVLNQWILEKAGDPLYRFGRQRGTPLDPSAQTEDLGDDSMYASELGIKNLKRIVPELINWSEEEGKNFEDLKELYMNVIGQFNRYLGHVTANVGGVYENYQSYDEDKPVYTHVAKERQQRAMEFLSENLFTTPEWIIVPDILKRIEDKGTIERVGALQKRTIGLLLRADRQNRLIENELLNGEEAFTLEDMYEGLYNSIFDWSNMDVHKRNVQRIYVDELIELHQSDKDEIKNTDIKAMAVLQLNKIKDAMESKTGNDINSAHALELVNRIEVTLQPAK